MAPASAGKRLAARWLAPASAGAGPASRTLLLLLASGLAARAALGFAPPGEAPVPAGRAANRLNIVLILVDDQSAGTLALMPYLQSREDWVRLPNTFVNVPQCCPARANVLTGRYSHHNGVEKNNQGIALDDAATLPVWLEGAGYRTALFGKYLNRYPWKRGLYIPPGWSRWFAFSEGSIHYHDYKVNDGGMLRSYGSEAKDYSTDVLVQQATEFVLSSTEPFFVYFAPFAPHGPVTPARRHAEAFGTTQTPRSPSFNESDVSDKPAWVRSRPLRDPSAMDARRRDEWRASLAVDDAVKLLFEALGERGLLDRTVVFYLSDNGVLYGEHRLVGKRVAYEEAIRVPLLVRDPAASPRSLDQMASIVDLTPTIAEYAGIAPQIDQDGRSLVPLIRGRSSAGREAVLLRWIGGEAIGGYVPGYWAVRTNRHKYIELETGERELYDLRADPHELENLAGRVEHAAIQKQLAETLSVLRDE